MPQVRGNKGGMMQISDIRKGKNPRPRRAMIYGSHGLGKSTWCSKAPNPIFIQTEDGLGEIDCSSFPLAESYDQVVQAIKSILDEEHTYETLIIDSLDWLERLIWQDVCRKKDVKNIEDIPYAGGYKLALSQWNNVLEGLSVLRHNRKMHILLTAHTRIEKFEVQGGAEKEGNNGALFLWQRGASRSGRVGQMVPESGAAGR